MIIYSPIPPEVLWYDAKQTDFRLVEDVIAGIPVQLRVSADNSYKVERVLSTDPYAYLQPSCQPGSEVEYLAGPKH
ncbi:MAG: YlzJ-like family protein [Peptococcaceae bacterium]|nr:YlzJ-like family protein [Peptococcaceae bacterium]MDH7524103.1 YlzJ-like family protein [Peptococcaceae bacterium]